MDNIIGHLNWEACSSCVHREEDDDCKHGPDFHEEFDDLLCLSYKEGDPKTAEEIEAGKEALIKAENDKKYQTKFFHKDG